MKGKGRSQAFTLLELLVALSIVAILAVLGVATLNSTFAKARDALCVSNLRQMGAAMASYCADNDGYLPGPAYSSLPSTYYTRLPNSITTLTAYLAPYLGVPTDPWRIDVCETMICPAYKQEVPEAEWPSGFSYIACVQVVAAQAANEVAVSPWGRPDGDIKRMTQTPLRLVALNSLIRPESVYAIQDADALNYGSSKPGVAELPVHGNHRNRLYFDFHVASVPVE